MVRKAIVPTQHSSRYLQQLSKHWAHRFDVVFTAELAVIKFPEAQVALTAHEDTLIISLTSEKEADFSRLQEAIETHIDGFAHREAPLKYNWQAF